MTKSEKYLRKFQKCKTKITKIATFNLYQYRNITLVATIDQSDKGNPR
jgi:hypothetical protein